MKRGPYKVKPKPIIALSPHGAAAALGIHITKVRRMIADGLPSYRDGIHTRILVADLERFIRKNWRGRCNQKALKSTNPFSDDAWNLKNQIRLLQALGPRTVAGFAASAHRSIDGAPL
jgi:excisionase family DNA binding protein